MSREYFITIQATDRGMPPLSNTAVVKINVTDYNDNSPMFAQEQYVAQVREDAQRDDRVIQVGTRITERIVALWVGWSKSPWNTKV